MKFFIGKGAKKPEGWDWEVIGEYGNNVEVKIKKVGKKLKAFSVDYIQFVDSTLVNEVKIGKQKAYVGLDHVFAWDRLYMDMDVPGAKVQVLMSTDKEDIMHEARLAKKELEGIVPDEKLHILVNKIIDIRNEKLDKAKERLQKILEPIIQARREFEKYSTITGILEDIDLEEIRKVEIKKKKGR